jgi:signal transduction histidine kinase
MGAGVSWSGHESALGELSRTTPVGRRPWRRTVVLSAAALLFAATLVARELIVPDQGAAVGLLFVIPVALVGLELGLRTGVALALGTILIVALRRSSTDPALDALGVVTRGVALMAVAVLAGHFSDRTRASQLRQAELLAAERERAALLGEMHGMRRRLQDQVRNAGHILDLHEQERRGIAEQLHEQAAQAMAAALLIVGRLERDIVDELTQAQLQRARHSVHHCIAELRRLAGSLYSPVLEELGLPPALERLVEREQQNGTRAIDLHGADGLPQLSAEVEISAYRAIEEALKAIPGPIGMHIEVDVPSESLQIVIEGGGNLLDDGELLTTRARLEMVGGSLSGSRVPGGFLLVAAIPLRRELDLSRDGEQASVDAGPPEPEEGTFSTASQRADPGRPSARRSTVLSRPGRGVGIR